MSQNNMNYSGAQFTRSSNQIESSKNYVKDESTVSNLSDYTFEDYKTFKFSRVENAASSTLFANAINNLKRKASGDDFSLENIASFLYKKRDIAELSDLFDARILESELDKNILKKIYEKLETSDVKDLINESVDRTKKEIDEFRSAIALIRTHIEEYNAAYASLTSIPDNNEFDERIKKLQYCSSIRESDLKKMSKSQRIIYSLREIHFYYYRGYFKNIFEKDRNTKNEWLGTTRLHDPVWNNHNNGHYNIKSIESKRDAYPNSLNGLDEMGDLADVALRCSVITSILRRAAGVARMENTDEGRNRGVTTKLPIDSITGGTGAIYTTEDNYPDQSIGKYLTVKKNTKSAKFDYPGRDSVALLEPTGKGANGGIINEYKDLDQIYSSSFFFKDVLHDPLNHKMELFSEYINEMESYVKSSKEYIIKLTCSDQDGSLIMPHVLFKRVLEDFQRQFSLLAEGATLREVTANFFIMQSLEEPMLFELVRNRVAQLLAQEDMGGAEVEKSAHYSVAINDRGRLGNGISNTRRALNRDPENLQAIIDAIQSRCFDHSDPFKYSNTSKTNAVINTLRYILSNAGELDADDRSASIGISMRNLFTMGLDVNSDLNIINMIAKLYIEIEKECDRVANLDAGTGNYFTGAAGRARGTRIKFTTIMFQLCSLYKKMTTFGSLEPLRLRNDPDYSRQPVQTGLLAFALADIGGRLDSPARDQAAKDVRNSMTQFYNDHILTIAMRLGYDFSQAKNFSSFLEYVIPAIGEMKPDSIDKLFGSNNKIAGTSININQTKWGLSYKPQHFSNIYHSLVKEANGVVNYFDIIEREIKEYKEQTDSMVSLSEKFNQSGEDSTPIRKLYEARKFDKYLKTTSNFAVNNLDYRLDKVSEIILNNDTSLDINLLKFVKSNFLNLISSSQTSKDDGGTFVHVLGLDSGKILEKARGKKDIQPKAHAKIKMHSDNLFFYSELKTNEENFEKQIRISVDENYLCELLKQMKEDGETYENFENLIPRIKFRLANDAEFLGKTQDAKASLGISSTSKIKSRLKTTVQDFITQKALETLYGLEFNASIVSKASIENASRSTSILPIMCEAVKMTGGDDSAIKELYTVSVADTTSRLMQPTLERQISYLKPTEESTTEGIVVKPPRLTEEHLILAGLLYSTKSSYAGMLESMLLSPAIYDEVFFIRTKMNNLIDKNMLDLSKISGDWPTAQQRGVQTNQDRQAVANQIVDMAFGVDYTSRKFSLELKDL